MLLLQKNLNLLKSEIESETKIVKKIKFHDWNLFDAAFFNQENASQLKKHLNNLSDFYSQKYVEVDEQKNKIVSKYQGCLTSAYLFKIKEMNYTNDYLTELVTKSIEKNKLIAENGKFVQVVDPIYKDPKPRNILDFRAHFYSPLKHFGGLYFSTFIFNIMAIWLMTFLLYFTLYFDGFKKMGNLFSRISFPKINFHKINTTQIKITKNLS